LHHEKELKAMMRKVNGVVKHFNKKQTIDFKALLLMKSNYKMIQKTIEK